MQTTTTNKKTNSSPSGKAALILGIGFFIMCLGVSYMVTSAVIVDAQNKCQQVNQ